MSQISVVNGCKNVVLRSIVAFKNHYPADVSVLVEKNGDRMAVLATMANGETWYAPNSAVYTDEGSFCLALAGEGENIGMDYFR